MYDNGDWGIGQRGRLRKTWWDCVGNDMRSFGLTCEVAQDKVGERELTGHLANTVLPRNWLLNRCVCVV